MTPATSPTPWRSSRCKTTGATSLLHFFLSVGLYLYGVFYVNVIFIVFSFTFVFEVHTHTHEGENARMCKRVVLTGHGTSRRTAAKVLESESWAISQMLVSVW